MKLKNILPIVGILFALFSCSLEDDQIIYNEIESSVKGQNKDAFVNVSFAITAGDVSTKGGSSSATTEEPGSVAEKTIASCSVIILDGNDVKVIENGLTLSNNGLALNDDDELITKSFLLEAKKTYTVMVVANPTKNIPTTLTSLDAVNDEIQTVTSFEADKLVKVGSATKYVGNGYTTIAEAAEADNIVPFDVTVSQLAAKIEFAGFDFKNSEGLTDKVTITSVVIKNLNKSVKTSADNNAVKGTLFDYETAGAYSAVVFEGGEAKAFTKLSAYTFPNNFTNPDNTPIKMTVNFTVGSESKESTFVINRPGSNNTDMTSDPNYDANYTNNSGHTYVKSNHIYRVTLAPTLKDGAVSYELVCYTLDWKYNKIEIDLN